MNDLNQTIGEAIDRVGDFLYQGLKHFAREMEEIAIEIEEHSEELLSPLYDWLDSIDDVISDTSRPFVQTVSPVLQDHPACVGCAHYHGETYGENLLVCAMHPYGAEDVPCTDWQSVWDSDS